MTKVKYGYFVVVKKSTYLSFLYFCTWKIMRQINTNMFHFLKKYSPDYAQNTIEGWSIILVVAVGCEVASFANSWLGMLSMFLIGVLCAHIIACIIKYCMTNKWFKGYVLNRLKLLDSQCPAVSIGFWSALFLFRFIFC